jgi:hypothetical protein
MKSIEIELARINTLPIPILIRTKIRKKRKKTRRKNITLNI